MYLFCWSVRVSVMLLMVMRLQLSESTGESRQKENSVWRMHAEIMGETRAAILSFLRTRPRKQPMQMWQSVHVTCLLVSNKSSETIERMIDLRRAKGSVSLSKIGGNYLLQLSKRRIQNCIMVWHNKKCLFTMKDSSSFPTSRDFPPWKQIFCSTCFCGRTLMSYLLSPSFFNCILDFLACWNAKRYSSS